MHIHFRRLVVPAVFAFGILLWNGPISVAQQGPRLGVGSTWTRRPIGPQPPAATRSTGNSNQPPAGQRFFGGVTVGPGVATFPPGYFGAIYNIPGYGYTYGYPGVSFVPGILPYGGFPTPGLPFASYSPYSFANPYLTEPLVGPALPFTYGTSMEPMVPGGIQDFVHAPAIPIASPQVSFDRGFLLRQPFQTAGPITWNLVQRSIAEGLQLAPSDDEFKTEARSLTVSKEPIDRADYRRLLHEGDIALGEGDLDAAMESYQAALATLGPQFHALHRLAMTQLWQHDFTTAAGSLREGLLYEVDSAIPLLTSNSMQGRLFTESEVWEWLMERPGSIDRLNLIAAWLAAEGDEERASTLTELATTANVVSSSTQRLSNIITGKFNEPPASHSDQPSIE